MLYGSPPGELAGMGLIKSPVDTVRIEEFPYLQRSELSQSFMKMYDEMMDSFHKTGFE